MIVAILFLDLENLVKVASTMMLLLFVFVNVSVIIMRESKIVSYKPEYASPCYPYVQIAGIAMYMALILQMGKVSLLITSFFFFASLLWYFLYSKSRSLKESALIHIVERVTSREIQSSTLTDELREILIERDEIIEDRFDTIIKNAVIIDIQEEFDSRKLFHILADVFSKRCGVEADTVFDLLMQREAESTTAVHAGLAIPHIIIDGSNKFDIVVMRSKKGILFGENISPVHIVFALAGTRDERNFHLKALMAIAQIVQSSDFLSKWGKAGTVEDIRNLILLAQRVRKGKV